MNAKGFTEYLRMSVAEFSPPVRSLLDIDFYKFTMGQLIHKHFPDVDVTFELIVRDPEISLGNFIDEAYLRQSLDYAMSLGFLPTDLYFLRGIDLYEKYMFKDYYLDSLRTFHLPPYNLSCYQGKIALRFSGCWWQVSMWETIALAIISELYYRSVLKKIPKYVLENIYRRAQVRVYDKLEKLQAHPNISFADFGQRRRHSFLWQEWVIGLCKNMLGEQFTGTSNTWMAFRHNLPAIGTNAHEPTMVLTALAQSKEEMIQAQYRVLELWQEMYGKGLRIFLPDTYGSEQFFAGAPDWLKDWRGQRQDSGDPKVEGKKYIQWLLRKDIDPAQRLTIFSDGLDVNPMIDIDSYFGTTHKHAYGWGTLLTNDFAGCDTDNLNLRPFSMICKVVSANGHPCVKLSNNTHKATGPSKEIDRYLGIFTGNGRISQKVFV